MELVSRRRRRRPRTWGRGSIALAALAVLAGSLPALVATAGPASAASDPSQITFTLEGCRNDGSITFPASGPFVCPDAAYTTGNLGKGWNELDLVPHRVTLRNTSATQTYSFVVAGDYKNGSGTGTGWDVISPLTKKAGSAAACPTVTSDPTVITPLHGGVGGADQTIYRLVTITQPVNTTCSYDYYQRLALGAHNFSGSSLQSNLWNQSLSSTGIGQKRLSLPVGEIKPQSLAKAMTATQGEAYNWELLKSSTPTTLGLGNTCDPTNTRVGAISTTITWTRIGPAPAGQIAVHTTITATNPASRSIRVTVSDDIRSGTTVLDTHPFAPVDVPANSTNYVIGSHDFTVPAGTANLNDVATATYTDVASGVTVPGTTTATASATVASSGTTTDATAVITDTETLTGSAFEFRILSASAGSFTGGYVAGTWGTAAVGWSSGTVSGSGSAVLSKEVRTTSATVASGTLSDTANLVGSTSVTAQATSSSSLNATATVSATISKSMNQVFAGDKTFAFSLFSGTGVDKTQYGATSVTIGHGSSSGSSTTITGLDPALSYYFDEAATAPFPPQTTASFGYALVAGSLASCSATVSVTNNAAPATARVQKLTVPTGSTSWAFVLSGGGIVPETQNATAGAGYVDFATVLEADGQTYTITETPQTGWDTTSVSGGITGTNARNASTSTSARTCAITLNLTTDSGAVLSCSFTNTQRADVRVTKTLSGQTIPSGSPYSFPFTLTGGPASVNLSATASGANGGALDFGLLQPGSYTLCEQTSGAAWGNTWSLNGAGVTPVNPNANDVPAQDLGTRCYTFALAAGVDAAFVIDNRPPPGGGQRTIGYWKNWNSVNRSAAFLSKQHATHAIVDDFIGATGNPGSVLLGNVTVDTVQKAVNVLSDASTKYAEHGLGAQLLAAKLNVLAGAAPSCTSITAVISTADAMLSSVGWSDANYQTSKIVGSNYNNGTYTRAQIVAVHSTLDAYNNGTCP